MNKQRKIDELEKSISNLMLEILPPLKLHVILEDKFENLFKQLEELKILMVGKTDIKRSLAGRLFHFYYLVQRDMSFLPHSEHTNYLQSQLTILIVSVFNDEYFK